MRLCFTSFFCRFAEAKQNPILSILVDIGLFLLRMFVSQNLKTVFSLRCFFFTSHSSLRRDEEFASVSLLAAHTIAYCFKLIDSHYWAAGWLWLESWPSAGGCLWGGGHRRMWSQGLLIFAQLLERFFFYRVNPSVQRGRFLQCWRSGSAGSLCFWASKVRIRIY